MCRGDVPGEHKTLRIHLNRAHSLELLAGCPECFYYRGRWSDVKKHCEKHHKINIDSEDAPGGCAWGLTKLDSSKDKPTYSTVSKEDICVYPLETDFLTIQQRQIVSQAASSVLNPPKRTGR